MNKKEVVYDLIAYKLSLKTDPKNRKLTKYMHNISYYFDCHNKIWWEIHIIFLNIG